MNANCIVNNTRLRIDVESGGRRLIRITDDGCGMLRDDALLAFERHATSKLRDVGDLLTISTLGFRGEALPSIASVSRLVLETRSPDEATGTLANFAQMERRGAPGSQALHFFTAAPKLKSSNTVTLSALVQTPTAPGVAMCLSSSSI